ncbi:MAG TPA: OmpA family protein, partial [Alphaproteobacteria bacterium]|nr:OmpA family protein [Alphaproteobacteria bacterium]
EISEARDREQEVVISDLGARLNQALAAKVEELSRYRSEFFGRLREVLGQRRDITIVGDRFVFQSEVLFASGRAELGDDGKSDLAEIAATLLEIASTIPEDITWVLRVDGHTDAIPIATPQFPSNWELSAARAISVVQFLIERGIPAQRLAATGFGEFQPIDPGIDEIANRRNRRIELKLTER